MDSLLCKRELLLAESDAGSVNSVFARRVHDKSTPATADIQQPLARTKPQLAANVFELLLLRGSYIVVGRFEIGAGIHHRWVEPQLVKVVGEIVVKADCLAVASLRVGAAVKLGTSLLAVQL